MLRLNGKKVSLLWIGAKRVSILWAATRLQALKIYEGIRSCYGSGRWLPDKPWLNDDKWKN